LRFRFCYCNLLSCIFLRSHFLQQLCRLFGQLFFHPKYFRALLCLCLCLLCCNRLCCSFVCSCPFSCYYSICYLVRFFLCGCRLLQDRLRHLLCLSLFFRCGCPCTSFFANRSLRLSAYVLPASCNFADVLSSSNSCFRRIPNAGLLRRLCLRSLLLLNGSLLRDCLGCKCFRSAQRLPDSGRRLMLCSLLCRLQGNLICWGLRANCRCVSVSVGIA